jgi:DNA primase
MAPAPILCFDGDAAGRKAAHRALETALPYLEPSRSLQFAFLPEGRDPDDMVQAGETEALANILAKPVPLIDVLWSREQPSHPLQTPEQRASLEARLMQLAAQIEHKSLKYHYITALRERLRAAAKTRSAQAWGAFAGRGHGRDRRTSGSAGRLAAFAGASAATGSLLSSKIAQPSTPLSAQQEALLIRAVIWHPWLLDGFLEEIAGLHFNDAECERLRNQVLAVHQAEDFLDNEKLLEHLLREGYGPELERVERATASAYFLRNASKEQVLEEWRYVMMLHGKAGILRLLEEAERDFRGEQTAENFSKLSAIWQESEIAAS